MLTGPFAGIEGVAVPRRGRSRLLGALGAVGEGPTVDLDGASLVVIGSGTPRARAAGPRV